MNNSKQSIIEFKDVNLSFGKNHVLRSLSFSVHKGEVFAIIGYSGSGKSVTLQTMVGLLTPQAGSIKVNGQQIVGTGEKELADTRRQFGYLFQSGALINWMTVEENVELPLREHASLSASKRKEVVKEKLELVSMLDAAKKYPGEISGGMKKRAALARAIALDPEIVLFDEPTSGLDPVFAYQIDNLIKDINTKLGITCIVVSHDLESIYTIADRVALFFEGRMHFVGSTDELRSSTDAEVRRFITGGREEDAEKTATKPSKEKETRVSERKTT